MKNLYIFSQNQKTFIKPTQRLQFVLFFVGATILSQGIPYLISMTPRFHYISEINPLMYIILISLLFGIFTGFCQYLILRKYIFNNLNWILAVMLNLILNNLTIAFFSVYFHSIQVFYFVLLMINIVNGYIQWFIIKKYVFKIQWWIFIPIMGIILGFIPSMINLLLININLYFPLNDKIIGLAIVPFTQAIGFCLLKKKIDDSTLTLRESPLASVSAINNYWKTKQLKKILGQRIDKLWKQELDQSFQELSYIIGVNSVGDEFIYESINQISKNYINYTPIITIGKPSNFNILNYKNKYAKFLVLFDSPAHFKIISLNEISVFLLAICGYSLIFFLAYLLII